MLAVAAICHGDVTVQAPAHRCIMYCPRLKKPNISPDLYCPWLKKPRIPPDLSSVFVPGTRPQERDPGSALAAADNNNTVFISQNILHIHTSS